MSEKGKRIDMDKGILFLLLAGLVVSVIWFARTGLDSEIVMSEEQPELMIEKIDTAILQQSLPKKLSHVHEDDDRRLFASELRVAAIGSAYPIPYAAEICPYTQTPQPTMDQLDRDGDGMTDAWEEKFGMNRYDAADAILDFDEDGFTHLEEFHEGTDPNDHSSHPAYALKFRFLKQNEVKFPLVFKGASQLSDGNYVFQINTEADGSTHFLSLNEQINGIVLKRWLPADGENPDRLVVVRESVEVYLPRGEIVADPESYGELINILDRSTKIVTMGALLSLRNDEYSVLGVYPDKVVVRQVGTGKVYDIVGLTDEERKMLL